MFRVVPGGFIPAQDKQYLIGIVQLPDAASLDRTENVVRRISQLAKETPGVDHVIGFSGLSVQGFVNLSNAAVLFFPLKPFDERTTKKLVGGRHRRRAQQEIQHHSGCRDLCRAAARRCRAWAPPADSSSLCRIAARTGTTNWRESPPRS